MYITCLDLEGVLVPEIWIAFAEATGIPELKRTTRDEPDYDKLMKWRIGVLKEHGLGLKEIQDTIAKIDPLEGAKEFLDELRSLTQVIILSDTFSQYLLYLIQEKGLTNVDVYKRSILCDKKTFSKIKNNINYHPDKRTALCLCVGARLNLDEAVDLLARAGYAFSPCDKQDVIFSYFLEKSPDEYDMVDVDIELENYELPCIIA